MSAIFTRSIFAILCLSGSFSWAASRTQNNGEVCRVLVGGLFLHQHFPALHTTIPGGQDSAVPPIEKIENFLSALQKNEGATVAAFKQDLLEKNVICSEEIPESFFEFQKRLALEQGFGSVKMKRSPLIRAVVEDQRKSLEQWTDYLFSPDAAVYPMWTKIWILTSVVKLGRFDKEKGEFGNRSRGQVAAFPELNREALAIVIDGIVRYFHKESLEEIKDQKFLELLPRANFGKLYGYRLKILEAEKPIQDSVEKSAEKSTEGQWVTFKQGSNPRELLKSIQGKNTGWCTAGPAVAKQHLAGGDFHVFYSNDESGKPTIPRVAIRMEGAQIAEIRGVAKEQNLDPQIAESDVLKRKLTEFGTEGERYEKKTRDMQRLTEIEKRNGEGQELTVADLRFLYEVDEPILGFGWDRDPRIAKILKKRDHRADVVKAYDGHLKPSEISLTQEEFLKGGIKFHYGNLYIRDLKIAKELGQVLVVNGDLDFAFRGAVGDLTFPQKVSGDVSADFIKSARNLILPKVIGGIVYLRALEKVDTLLGAAAIQRDLFLSSLKSVKQLSLGDFVGRDLVLDSLKSLDGIKFPSTVVGTVYLSGARSVKGTAFPNYVGGDLILSELKNATGASLPRTIGGHLVTKESTPPL